MSRMSDRLRRAIDTEIQLARTAELRGEFHTAFRQLERAHVLAQRSTAHHVRVHWLMLRFAMRNRLTGEAMGQLWRVGAAALLTRVGLLPWGNPGGSGVSGFTHSPVAPDLQRVIDNAQ